MIEVWKEMTEGPWEISNCGRMRLMKDRNRHKAGYVIKWRPINCTRYLGSVLVGYDGKKRMYCPHVLVARYFIGPREPGMTVNHKDGNKFNNHVSNLEYMTLSENAAHAVALGLWKPLKQVSDGKLRRIKRYLDAGKSAFWISQKMHCSRGTICRHFGR